MDGLHDSTDTVHPEVRAYINSLVSALGGVSADNDGQYQLGDDATEVLRDIKRWIRFYDEKTNRMDVARCLCDSNIIEGDLLPILAQWPEHADDNKSKARLALACLEVLVPLTWPLDRDQQSMTVNHHRHMPVLQLAQVQYKRSIINFDGCRILHTAVRTALPSLAMPIGDRTARDQGIVKLALFFLRNLAMISPPPETKYDGDESQISRSATIDAFSYQDIFMLLLTIASTMGEEFRTEDTVAMEILYHLVKRVDPEQLFMSEDQVNKSNASKLSTLMLKESNMLKACNRNGPTRHNRFGSMLWVRREGGKMSTISGQDALADPAARNERLDSNKTFKPPRRARRRTNAEKDLGPPVRLNARAKTQLRSFVEEFLDSGFNPLFGHIRKTIDREALHVMNYHKRQFFYLVAWFLQAERVRRHDKQNESRKEEMEVTSFNLVATVLNQEMFITLTRALHESYDYKDWQELTAVMRCFTEILLTVQEMTSCGNDEDEEIADNILNRLFYEETTHDAVANIIRTYKDQDFDYIDASTELAYHFLRILEAYSKQNSDMQVRSRKRGRRKKQAGKQDNGMPDATEGNVESVEEEEAAVERSSKERRFDFHRFSSKFTPQGVVDTFAAFTRYYNDLSEVQLKRAHRYFYRLAFKQEMSVMLFRVDIIKLFHDMVRGPASLKKTSPMFRDWEELTKQILRRCFKKIDDRPELLVEMLFSKLPGTAFFLEYGYEKQIAAAKKPARPGVELEFKSATERDQQIAILVGTLLDRSEADHIVWLKGVLAEAQDQRRSWQVAEQARMPDFGDEPPRDGGTNRPPVFHVRTDGPSRQTAIFKNSYLRLLMTCCRLQRLESMSEETPESSWIIPDEVSAQHIQDSLHFISQAEFDRPTFEDGGSAEKQLKRKAGRSPKESFTGDSDDPEMDDEFLFPQGGPTARRVIDEEGRPRKLRRKRRHIDEEVEAQDEVLDARAQKRRERELEKARRIKSALYVREGDDEFDSEEDAVFFARERAIAARAKEAAASAATHPVPTASKRVSDMPLTQSGSGSQSSNDDSDDSDADIMSRTDRIASPRDQRPGSDNGEIEVEMGGDDQKNGAMSSDGDTTMPPSQEPPALPGVDEVEDVPARRAKRSRVRSAFMESSDEDDELG